MMNLITLQRYNLKQIYSYKIGCFSNNTGIKCQKTLKVPIA